MNDYKFNKLLSDTITLPILPANKFTSTDTEYYAVLEKNYIPTTSTITCIYKPDWITGYKFTTEDTYYNKLSITSINNNEDEKLRKGIMEFAVSNNLNSFSAVNHIYAKVSQAPHEEVGVHLEFIPTEQQEKDGLTSTGGSITGNEQEIHLKYYGILNGRNQSNVTLTIDNKSLDSDKIKSLKINSSDNSVELVYLIDENTDSAKDIKFHVTFKTQYNTADTEIIIKQKQNVYNISLSINNIDNINYIGDNRILIYSCNVNNKKEITSGINLEFTYITNENELKYVIQNTTYTDKKFNTTINIEKNYTNEIRKVKVKAVYNINDNKIIESNEITITQEKTNIVIQYYVEWLNRNSIETETNNGSYEVDQFGEIVRIHYYGKVDNGDKITQVINTKNGITNVYSLDAYYANTAYIFTNILNNDEYIFDINFSRNEANKLTRIILMVFRNITNITNAVCTLNQESLTIELSKDDSRCTKIIGGIPQFNNIILTFRAYDTIKNDTVEDINLYNITGDSKILNLSDIQYEIITYNNIKYIVASNIRCKEIYFDEKGNTRDLTITITYNTGKNVTHTIKQNSVTYDVTIQPSSNVISSMGNDNFKVICTGITNDNHTTNKLYTYTDTQQLTTTLDLTNINKPAYADIILTTKTLNNSNVYLKVNASDGTERSFYIVSKYKTAVTTYEIKQLALSLGIEFYKDSNYLLKIDDIETYGITISPFTDNYIYFKCYLYEISNEKDENGNFKHVIIDVNTNNYGIGITYKDSSLDIKIKPQVDSKDDIEYINNMHYGKFCMPMYICQPAIEYDFEYSQDYSNRLNLKKTISITKPLVYTLSSDNTQYISNIRETIPCIQYRSDESNKFFDSPTNNILLFDSISSNQKEYSLYYRVVYAINIINAKNYIYNIGEYVSYIDIDKEHFKGVTDNFKADRSVSYKDIKLQMSEIVIFNNEQFLKIPFTVNENVNLYEKIISMMIQYDHYTFDNINEIGGDIIDDNNVYIRQNKADILVNFYFDSKNSGILEYKNKKITYTGFPQENKQYLYFNIKINNQIHLTNVNHFIINNDENDGFIKNSIIVNNDECMSEYNLNNMYIETDNLTYEIKYIYYDNSEPQEPAYGSLTLIRKSFAQDNDCTLHVNIDKQSVSNNGDEVTITFYLTYNGIVNNINLGESAKSKFLCKLNNDDITPSISYNETSYIYSFNYEINANFLTSTQTYDFTIIFGGKHGTVTCTQRGSKYTLCVNIDPVGPLEPLNPSNVIVTCYITKDEIDEAYTDGIDQTKFNITNNDSGHVKLIEIVNQTPGIYAKKYEISDNKEADEITYTFNCTYIDAQSSIFKQLELSKDVTIKQKGAIFGVEIEDSETSDDKKNIVVPGGEQKIIRYRGLLNGVPIVDTNEVTFTYTNKDYITNVSAPTIVNNYIQRNITFDINKSENSIDYTFTAKYQDKETNVILTQSSANFELYCTAYYTRNSTKIEDDEELDLLYTDNGYFYISYYAKVKNNTTMDLDKSHYTIEYEQYNDGDMIYELPINFSLVETTVDNTNNVILTKCKFSQNNDDSYDYERYVNFIIKYYLSNVEDISILVMQDSSFNIELSPFDFLIFKYIFISPSGNNSEDKDKMNTQAGYDLDTITHITNKNDIPMPYNMGKDASTGKDIIINMNYITAGFSQPVGTNVKTYKDIILFGGDNIAGNQESVYVNMKNVINSILSNNDKKYQKQCRYIYIDLYGHWFQPAGNGRIKVTYNTYNIRNTEPDLTIKDYIIETTDIPVNSEVVIYPNVLDKNVKSNYTLLGRLTYDLKRSSATLVDKTLYGYKIKDESAKFDGNNIKYKISDRTYKDYNISAIIINKIWHQFDSLVLLNTFTLLKSDSTGDNKEFDITSAIYSQYNNKSVGMQYYNFSSFSMVTSTVDHLVCTFVSNKFTLNIKDSYKNYSWPTTTSNTIDILFTSNPVIKYKDTENVKFAIRIIEQKYTETTS